MTNKEKEKNSCGCVKVLGVILFIAATFACLYAIDKNVTDNLQKINEKIARNSHSINTNSIAITKLCKVSHNKTTIHYLGGINKDCYEQFSSTITLAKEELKKSNQKLELLVITSTGGESSVGIDIGNIVRKNGLNIEVKDYCISACANYIFPAGKNKYINKNAVVGWHGGTLEKDRVDHLEKISGKMIRDEVRKYRCSSIYGTSSSHCKEGLYNEIFKDEKEDLDLTTEDLYKISEADTDIINYGINDGRGEQKDFDLVKDNDYDLAQIRFWTISIEDMEEFGITNISYGGDSPDDYLKDVCGKNSLFKFRSIRCFSSDK